MTERNNFVESDAEKVLLESKCGLKSNNKNGDIKLYKYRWFILIIYVLYAASSAVQWVQYCIISNIVMKYYNISAVAVDWTSIITMITYVPLVLPASYIIDKMGLRVSVIIGTLVTTFGTWLKVFSASPDLFWVGFLAQTIIFCGQIFILSLPARVAAVWFGEEEVSRACAFGVFGSQFGTALGFQLSPMLVKNHDNLDDIGTDLLHLFYSVAIYSSIVSILIIIYFKAEPELPPSQAQLDIKNDKQEFTMAQFYQSYKSLLLNKPFLLLLVSYGMNIAVFAGICTVLNQFILSYFPDSVEDSGNIGLLMVIIGMAGSLIFGYVLDKSRKYKETTLAIYMLVTLSVCLFVIALERQSIVFVYISAAIMGFFQNAYYPVGFEMAAELTFPEPESTSSGLLVGMAQTFGTIFTLLMGKIFEQLGAFWALAAMIILLAFGCVLTALIPNVLKRQDAFNKDINYDGIIKKV